MLSNVFLPMITVFPEVNFLKFCRSSGILQGRELSLPMIISLVMAAMMVMLFIFYVFGPLWKFLPNLYEVIAFIGDDVSNSSSRVFNIACISGNDVKV